MWNGTCPHCEIDIEWHVTEKWGEAIMACPDAKSFTMLCPECDKPVKVQVEHLPVFDVCQN